MSHGTFLFWFPPFPLSPFCGVRESIYAFSPDSVPVLLLPTILDQPTLPYLYLQRVTLKLTSPAPVLFLTSRSTGSFAYKILALRCCMDTSNSTCPKQNLSASPISLSLNPKFQLAPKSLEERGGYRIFPKSLSCPNIVSTETPPFITQIPAITFNPVFPLSASPMLWS